MLFIYRFYIVSFLSFPYRNTFRRNFPGVGRFVVMTQDQPEPRKRMIPRKRIQIFFSLKTLLTLFAPLSLLLSLISTMEHPASIML